MKNLLLSLFVIILLSHIPILAFSEGKPADQKATPETVLLFEKMHSLLSKGIMIGHQDDLAYGIGWKYPNGQSDVFSVSGDYPAVFGWDLGHLELGSAYNLDSVAFSDMIRFAKWVHQQGGINQFSWHCDNPLTRGSTWDVSDKRTVKSILPGGEKHSVYTGWLDKVAGFLLNLRDDEGKLIPVLFRPFHELEGDWFWWGKPYCNSDEFRELYRFTINYLREAKEVHNMITLYSNADTFTNCDSFLDRYPGGEYVDMIGFDVYQSPQKSNADFANMVKQMLTVLDQAAVKTGKMPAITEMGYEQIPYSTWWTEVLWPVISDVKLSYVLFWRNAANRPNHYYMPYPGQMSEQDFLRFSQLPGTIFLNDLK